MPKKQYVDQLDYLLEVLDVCNGLLDTIEDRNAENDRDGCPHLYEHDFDTVYFSTQIRKLNRDLAEESHFTRWGFARWK